MPAMAVDNIDTWLWESDQENEGNPLLPVIPGSHRKLFSSLMVQNNTLLPS